MFCSHLDTYSSTKKFCKVNHVIDDNIIKTDGTTILGADDKGGVVLMLNMVQRQIPGLYYFFTGEEVGCIVFFELARTIEYKQQYNELPNIKMYCF